MAKKKDWRADLEQVVEQLRDPFRMRIVVAGVALAVMYFAISNPLHGRMQQSQRDFDRMQSTADLAEEVLLLRSHLDRVDQRIISGNSNDVIVSHLIDLVRNQPVDLIRIDAEAPTRLGPLQSVRISLDVNGSFDALAKMLHRLESDQYLFRVETVSISPPQRDNPDPSMQLQIRTMKDPS